MGIEEPKADSTGPDHNIARSTPSTIDLTLDEGRLDNLNNQPEVAATSFKLLGAGEGRRLEVEVVNIGLQPEHRGSESQTGYNVIIWGSKGEGPAMDREEVSADNLEQVKAILHAVEAEWANSMEKSKDAPPTLSELALAARQAGA